MGIIVPFIYVVKMPENVPKKINITLVRDKNNRKYAQKTNYRQF